MSEQRKPKRDSQPVRTVYFTGSLACGSCNYHWTVVDLNPHHKAVKCTVCGQPNDIFKAIQRAA
jgi:transcription elongation factor Elf1